MYKSEKINEYCLEIYKEDVNHLFIAVGINNLNKVSNQLRDCGVELHFNYGIEMMRHKIK